MREGRRARGARRWLPVVVVGLGTTGCSMVGYPAPSAPDPVPVVEVPAVSVRGHDGADLLVRPPVEALPAHVRPEPLARSGNAGRYEVLGETYHTLPTADGYEQEGEASWYGEAFAGRPTSSGELFDPELLTAAHRSLPLPTWAEVTNLQNGRKVIVRINDRGPFAHTDRRIIDLSRAAARQLEMLGAGVARVRVRVLAGPQGT